MALSKPRRGPGTALRTHRDSVGNVGPNGVFGQQLVGEQAQPGANGVDAGQTGSVAGYK